VRDVLAILGDPVSVERQPAFRIEQAGDAATVAAYHALRTKVFVDEQALFTGHDLDEHDEDPRTVVLVARDRDGTVIGGVRLCPAQDGPDLGWWIGGRLVVTPSSRSRAAPANGRRPSRDGGGGGMAGSSAVSVDGSADGSVDRSADRSVDGSADGSVDRSGGVDGRDRAAADHGLAAGRDRAADDRGLAAGRHPSRDGHGIAAAGRDRAGDGRDRAAGGHGPASVGPVAPVPGWRGLVRGGQGPTGESDAAPDAGGRFAPAGSGGVGPALVRAACAYAENAGVLRFEATVQAPHEAMFTKLGWQPVRRVTFADTPHVLMRWSIGRIQALVDATKRDLGSLLSGLTGVPGFVGDDGVPVPGSDLVAACDAIVPSMVERDPDWAGWCSVLVNLNDLAAMGAEPIGLLDALGARDRSFASRVLAGLRRASQAYDVPVLGGHTQFGVPAALSVTALGKAAHPVPGGGGKPGHGVRLTADLGGHWRPGYAGRQWDSTTSRRTSELRAMLGSVGRARPAAAKDVSMAGIAGTLGMLAEASGCGAELDLARVPRPTGTSLGDWLTCFPGFAMLTTDEPGTGPLEAGPAVSVDCGRLVPGQGVVLCWPDGERTEVLAGGVTGLGRA
jgi:AIR synthase-related protein